MWNGTSGRLTNLLERLIWGWATQSWSNIDISIKYIVLGGVCEQLSYKTRGWDWRTHLSCWSLCIFCQRHPSQEVIVGVLCRFCFWIVVFGVNSPWPDCRELTGFVWTLHGYDVLFPLYSKAWHMRAQVCWNSVRVLYRLEEMNYTSKITTLALGNQQICSKRELEYIPIHMQSGQPTTQISKVLHDSTTETTLNAAKHKLYGCFDYI